MTTADPTVNDLPDFSIPRSGDLRSCPWWRPCQIGMAPAPDGDAVLAAFLPELRDAFAEHGHDVVPAPAEGADIMLLCARIPDGPEPLRDRVPELDRPLAIEVSRSTGVRRRPDNLVAVVSVPESLADRPHLEVAEAARVAMARLGAPKVVFVSGDRATGAVREATYCTMEGGHPTDRDRITETLRDRLVSAACAREVSEGYAVVPDAFPADAWARTRVPDALVAAGRRMDQLSLLPEPKQIGQYVSGRLARMYERLLGLKGFSEGMLFSYDPGLGALLVTASGSWDVDKRALRRDEVVPVGQVRDGKLEVLAPEGVTPKGPSVEAWEMRALLEAVPRVRLARRPDGGWEPDPEGTVEAPIVRGGIHVHVGVSGADERIVETVPANRELYPYGFGCGTDLMCGVAQDATHRSRAIHDPGDPRAYVRWPMLYHGDTLVELWKPGAPVEPLEGLLDLFDPEAVGAISYRPDHIDQPV